MLNLKKHFKKMSRSNFDYCLKCYLYRSLASVNIHQYNTEYTSIKTMHFIFYEC
jgi:hypothetical protein